MGDPEAGSAAGRETINPASVGAARVLVTRNASGAIPEPDFMPPAGAGAKGQTPKGKNGSMTSVMDSSGTVHGEVSTACCRRQLSQGPL